MSRLIDNLSTHGAPSGGNDGRTNLPRDRQIVGISLSPDTANAFKAEAKRRGLSVRKLFEEMWTAYSPPPGK